MPTIWGSTGTCNVFPWEMRGSRLTVTPSQGSLPSPPGSHSWWHQARTHCLTLPEATHQGTCLWEEEGFVFEVSQQGDKKQSFNQPLSPGSRDRFMGWRKSTCLGTSGEISLQTFGTGFLISGHPGSRGALVSSVLQGRRHWSKHCSVRVPTRGLAPLSITPTITPAMPQVSCHTPGASNHCGSQLICGAV